MRNNNIWIFNAGTSFAGNPKWYFLWLEENHPEIEKWWFCYDTVTLKNVKKMGFKACLYTSKKAEEVGKNAGVYVVEQCKEVFQDYLHGIKVLNLWHGVGCKTIETCISEGILQQRIIKKYIQNSNIYRNNTLFLVTSEFMENHFIQQCNLSKNQVIRGDYPKNIVLKRKTSINLEKIKANNESKLAVYAPTYRDYDGASNFFKAIPDMEKLITVLEKTNTVLIFKMHPKVENEKNFLLAKEKYASSPWVYCWDNQDDIYEVMDKFDYAIVDYSSIFYDLMAKGVKKFIRYFYDIDEPNAMRDFAYDCKSHTYGKICSDFESLVSAIEKQDFEENESEYKRIYNLFWSYSNRNSMENIFKSIMDFKVKEEALPTLYSFDIFDTLISRTCLDPKGVFYYVQDKLRQTTMEFPPYVKQFFTKIRKWGEANCREYYNKGQIYRKSDKFEISFDMIYDRIQELYNLTDEQKETLKNWELECEYETSIPVKENIDILKGYVENGDKVILISDMYLPESFIKKLLAKADPVLAELPLFLSSTYGYQKTTKKLFYEAYRGIDYNYGEWIHYGDNPNADKKQPRVIGIKTVSVKPVSFGPYEKRMIDFVNTYDGYQIARLFADFKAKKDGNGRKLHTDEEKYAYCFTSLYFVTYIDWVLKHALNKGIQCLYFISRDGYHLKRIADEFIEKRNLPIKTKYIYGSRKVWRIPSQIEKIDEEFFSEFGNFNGVKDFDSLLSALDISEEAFNSIFPELLYLKTKKLISGGEMKELRKLFSCSGQYKTYLLNKASEERKIVCDYLKQEINFSEKYAFVEYWGRGYTQTCLANLIDFIQGKKTENICYYSRTIYPTQENCTRYNFTGNNWSQIFIETIFANIPYKTISKYENVGDVIKPVLEENNECDLLIFEAMEKYLLKFVDDFIELQLNDEGSLISTLWDFGMSYFHNSPRDYYIKNYFSKLKDSVDLNGELHEYAPPISFRDAYRAVKGIKVPTSNFQMSLSKSNGFIKFFYKLYKRIIKK